MISTLIVVDHDVFVFLLGTLVAAFVVGVSGFAFGLVAAAVWLQSLTPNQVTPLIVLYALLVQGQATWRMRHAIVGAQLWPFIVGSAVGIPLGLLVLNVVTAGQLRLGVAALLIIFSFYSLMRPVMPRLTEPRMIADSLVGIINGAIGGSTGLAGIAIVIWTSVRGWKPHEQRAIFQPVAVATFLMCLPVFAGSGLLTAETLKLFVLGLPCLLLGNAIGWAVYGRLEEAIFRKVVLWLLLTSGVGLMRVGS
jgi:uncharacterized protein